MGRGARGGDGEAGVNDPRGILEEFAYASAKYRGARDESISANLDTESYRMTYRAKQETRGLCRSCKANAKPERKYCLRHLAMANERARRSFANARANLTGSS